MSIETIFVGVFFGTKLASEVGIIVLRTSVRMRVLHMKIVNAFNLKSHCAKITLKLGIFNLVGEGMKKSLYKKFLEKIRLKKMFV